MTISEKKYAELLQQITSIAEQNAKIVEQNAKLIKSDEENKKVIARLLKAQEDRQRHEDTLLQRIEALKEQVTKLQADLV